jgi:hypothetical protein
VCPWKSHKRLPFKGRRYLPLVFDNCIPAASILARRVAWQEGLPIPASFSFIDWYLNLRIARKFEIYYHPDILAEYRIHETNMHTHFPKDHSFERTVIAILDELFDEIDYEDEKRAIKSRAYCSGIKTFRTGIGRGLCPMTQLAAPYKP